MRLRPLFVTMTLLASLLQPLTASAAVDTPSDPDVQHLFEAGLIARDQGDLPQARHLLEAAVAGRPGAARIRFELGVVRGEMGDCHAASQLFGDAVRLMPTPAMQRARDAAMDDLCPRLAPFEGSFSLRFVHDTNPLAGAGASTVTIRGARFNLSDDAVAHAYSGVVAEGSLAYNHPIGNSLYVVPTIDFLVGEFDGSAADQQMVGGSLLLRRRGDIVDLRFGPTLGLDVTGGEIQSRTLGWTVFGNVETGPNSGLYFGADIGSGRSFEVGTSRDYTTRSGYLTLVGQLPGTDLTGSLGISAAGIDHGSGGEDLISVGTRAAIKGMMAAEIGFDLSIAYTRTEGDGKDPIFDVVRRDDIVTVGGALSFYRFEAPLLGRPSIGVAYTVSTSSLPTKDYDRIRTSFGFTREF